MKINLNQSRINRKLKYLLIVILLITWSTLAYSEDQSWKYLGQETPGNTPVVFGQGDVSIAGKNTHAVTISHDGKTIIFSRYPDKTSYIMTYDGNQWTAAVQSFFYGKETSFSPDGSKIFYYTGDDIYYVQKQDSGWATPVRLGPNINTENLTEYYPSIVQNQSMYFSREGRWDKAKIMYSEFKNGQYQPAVDLNLPINNGGASHQWVAPDESYMLFNSPRTGSYSHCKRA